MKNIIKEEAKEMKGIVGRIKRRDLKGNSGQAIKNSSYQLAIILIAKIGSLFFTIIIARLMLPEIYGLYGLTLYTVLFLGVFSDMGIGVAMNTFLSKNIDKSPGRARGYYKYLTKWKIILSAFSVLLVIMLSKWLAATYYQKPIYLALLAASVYLAMTIIQSHITSVFISTNNFGPLLIKEILLQTLRLTIITSMVVFLFSKDISIEIFLFWIFVALTFCYFIPAVYIYWKMKKERPFKKSEQTKLSTKKKQGLKRFMLPLTITAFSGVVFGYIDQIMLGHYVKSSFLGFYQASFNLTISAAAIMAFSSVAIFPILARLKGRKLEKGFRKSRNLTVIISILAASFTFILAPLIIRLIYGIEYLASIIYLQVLSILIITFPLIALYNTYYTSQERTKIISILLISSTALNVILNYIFINVGLQFNMSYAVMGACLATVISRSGYLGGLIIFRKWKKK